MKSFERELVDNIGDQLDTQGLTEYSSQLVVVGGAALAAYGIKQLEDRDIDIVVTQTLLERLVGQPKLRSRREYDHYGVLVNPSFRRDPYGIALRTMIPKSLGSAYGMGRAKRLLGSRVEVHTMPLQDCNQIDSDQMIAEGIVPPGSAHIYRFAPLERILSIKLNLAKSGEPGPAAAQKHLKDAALIAEHMLADRHAS